MVHQWSSSGYRACRKAPGLTKNIWTKPDYWPGRRSKPLLIVTPVSLSQMSATSWN